MKQNDLNRAVAQATGESISTIKRLGFLLSDPDDYRDPESEEFGPYVIDWDELDAQRHASKRERPRHEPTPV